LGDEIKAFNYTKLNVEPSDGIQRTEEDSE
jgi:hypothetical protein